MAKMTTFTADGYKMKKGSKVHLAVDTVGYLLALHVTPADEQERAQVDELAELGERDDLVEPFTRLKSQGMVLMDGAAMS